MALSSGRGPDADRPGVVHRLLLQPGLPQGPGGEFGGVLMATGVRDRLTLLLYIFLGLVGLYMLSPLILVTVDSFSTSTFGQFPPPGITWRWYIRTIAQG